MCFKKPPKITKKQILTKQAKIPISFNKKGIFACIKAKITIYSGMVAKIPARKIGNFFLQVVGLLLQQLTYSLLLQ